MKTCYECDGSQQMYDEDDKLVDCQYCDGKGKMTTGEIKEYNQAHKEADQLGRLKTKNKKHYL